MTEWGVVGVLIALVSFGVAIIKPIVSLTQSITKLTVIVDQLYKDLEEQRNHSKDSHQRLWCHNEAQDKRLDDHDHTLSDHAGRIERLEKQA